jgi:hypothetical protein
VKDSKAIVFEEEVELYVSGCEMGQLSTQKCTHGSPDVLVGDRAAASHFSAI